MTLFCCGAAGLHLGRRQPILNIRTTTTVASAAAASLATASLSPPQQRQVAQYVDALLDWNQRMNLTAVTDEAEVMTRHVADSLAMLPPLERAYRARSAPGGGDIDGVCLIDVGSGAGLPGLILPLRGQAGDLRYGSLCGDDARSWSMPLRSWGCRMWM